MRFIQETGFTVKPDKNRALQEWLIANQDRLAAMYPEGASFVGTFAAVYSSEKGAGDIRVMEQLDSYAALDRIAALGKDPESEYSKLIAEFLTFLDPSPTAAWSSVLLKDLVDATVYDMGAEAVAEREPVGVGR
jgi:hypothetical protein